MASIPDRNTDESPRPLRPSRNIFAALTAAIIALAFASPSHAAADTDVPKDGAKGATVTVLKAAKFCFPAIVEASGIIIPRENRQSDILGLAN